MSRIKIFLAYFGAFATLSTAFKSYAQETGDHWPAVREDRGSVIVVLEPEPDAQGSAIMLSGAGGIIDATPWYDASQPFVKQYLLEPGSYILQGSGDSPPTKLLAEGGRATVVELQVENPIGDELSYGLAVLPIADGEGLDLDEAQSRVLHHLAVGAARAQFHLSSLQTDGDELRFNLEPLSQYVPVPWPIPDPVPNPLPKPTPPSDVQE